MEKELLVDLSWLESNIDKPNVKLIEVDVSPKSYDEWHIPGAVLWNLYTQFKDDKYSPRTDDELKNLIKNSGINNDDTVVLYGYAPAFGFWLLKYFSHANVKILNIPKDTWKNQGKEISKEAENPEKSDYKFSAPNKDIRAGMEEVTEKIGNANTSIVDVRTENEYIGERFWPSGGSPDGGRMGHIKSAVSFPTTDILNPDGTIPSVEELRDYVKSANLDTDKELVTYCTIGARASLIWFILNYLLGYNAKVYDGSWVQWGLQADTPIEK